MRSAAAVAAVVTKYIIIVVYLVGDIVQGNSTGKRILKTDMGNVRIEDR